MGYQFEDVKVLLVEDNQPMLDLAKSLLESFGIGKVITAKDGDKGFSMFCMEKPDIVVTDWMMKPVNGIELSHKIRNDVSSVDKFVPIILMTGFSEQRRVLEARDAGITEFLVKPFNARDLYRRITQIIEKPRKFVRSDDFFGPDRRRKRDKPYDGELRRETDIRDEDYLVSMGRGKAGGPSGSDGSSAE